MSTMGRACVHVHHCGEVKSTDLHFEGRQNPQGNLGGSRRTASQRGRRGGNRPELVRSKGKKTTSQLGAWGFGLSWDWMGTNNEQANCQLTGKDCTLQA